LSYLYFIMFFV